MRETPFEVLGLRAILVVLAVCTSGCALDTLAAEVARAPRPGISLESEPAERWFGWPHTAPLRVEARFQGSPVAAARVFARPLDPSETLSSEFDVRDGAFHVEPGIRLAVGAFHPDHGYAEDEIVMPNGESGPFSAVVKVPLPEPAAPVVLDVDARLYGLTWGTLVSPDDWYPVLARTPRFGFVVARRSISVDEPEVRFELPAGTYDISSVVRPRRSCGLEPHWPDPVNRPAARVVLEAGQPGATSLDFERGTVLTVQVAAAAGTEFARRADTRTRMTVRALSGPERAPHPLHLTEWIAGPGVTGHARPDELMTPLERFTPGTYEFVLGGPSIERSVHRVEVLPSDGDLFSPQGVVFEVRPQH